MPSPRYRQIDIEATPYYHCISRCVRRAYLCGSDRATGRSFEHRKGWVVERLAVLTSIFAVRVCAYAIMSNHFHLVVYIDSERARGWSEAEVVQRYGRLFAGAVRLWQHLGPERQEELVACWRARLADLSWFMRCLNESIARRANEEEQCTGRFWEGRFRSQALLDLAGLLTCMSYVDLNPVRAGMARSLQDSEFTSIQQRLAQGAGSRGARRPAAGGAGGQALGTWPELVAMPRADAPAQQRPLGVDLDSYVELLTATGAALYGRHRPGGLPQGVQRTLEGAGIRSSRWLEAIRTYPRRFFAMIGCVHQIQIYCARTDRHRAKGTGWAGQVFRNCA